MCGACLLSTGGAETLHIKQPGIAVLTDVIESNEIQLSQQVLELRCCAEESLCEREKKKDKGSKHPHPEPETCLCY